MLTFAPAKRKNGGIKKEEYVHRHIELTAVLKEILRQKKKRVSESRDLKKTSLCL
jgi:hypothetical protein